MEVEVRVHPEDADQLREKPELLAKLRVSKVIEDPSIEAGGCVVESGERRWDATLESQIQEIHEQVRGAMDVQ